MASNDNHQDRVDSANPCVKNVDLRSRVLDIWMQAEGSPVEISCYGKTHVSGIFRGCDAQQVQMFAEMRFDAVIPLTCVFAEPLSHRKAENAAWNV